MQVQKKLITKSLSYTKYAHKSSIKDDFEDLRIPKITEKITSPKDGGILSIRGLPLTFAKMGIYGGIWANMAEYGQKIAKKGKTRGKTGGMGRNNLICFIYIFALKFQVFDY